MGQGSPFVKGASIGDTGSEPNREIDKELFAERFRMAMAKEKLKAAAVARELHVTRQLAASWARGEHVPQGPARENLPPLLRVDAAWLFPTGQESSIAGPGRSVQPRSYASEGHRDGPDSLAPEVEAILTRAGAALAPQVKASLKTVTTMQAALVARLVKEVLTESEIGHTAASRQAVIEFLERTAVEFRKFGADVSDLWAYARKLREERP